MVSKTMKTGAWSITYEVATNTSQQFLPDQLGWRRVVDDTTIIASLRQMGQSKGTRIRVIFPRGRCGVDAKMEIDDQIPES